MESMDTNSRLADLEKSIAQMTGLIQQDSSRQLQSYMNAWNSSSIPYPINSGDTAWMLFSCALVLFMTIPGLAIYYGGMVEGKNVLATVMQSLTITCLITFLWLCYGYSLSFAPVDFAPSKSVIGDSSRMWLIGMDMNSVHQLANSIPEPVYCVYQLTFAIITAALICGSFADRIKYGSMILFMAIWHTLVYCPIAHANWHPAGFLFKLGVLDYAGGNVVHISSGVAGLVATIVIGKRKGFGTQKFEPHNILLTFMGTSFLWVGWFGFNAGSATAANSRAGLAMLATQIATATASFSWMLVEWHHRKKSSVLGMLSGAVAGLVGITPAAGYVDYTGAFIIGLVVGPACYFGARLKNYFGYDDALDAFGVHAIGGIVGGILTGFFARADICGIDGAFFGQAAQIGYQFAGVLTSIGWSGAVTFVILIALDKTIGLRVSAEAEDKGLDISLHKETNFPDASSHERRVSMKVTPVAESGDEIRKPLTVWS